MSPQLIIRSAEFAASGGVPTGTGIAFVAGATDAGPPPGSPLYVRCQSLTEFINAFGPRSSSSAELYDWLDDFFQETGGGAVAYVTRVTDPTATTATLTLKDAGASDTIVVSALTPGTEGNNIYVTVDASSGDTFTATLASGNPDLTDVSSFDEIAAGTPIAGTGIPADTYLLSVDKNAGTAVMSHNATATGDKTITPGQVTVIVDAEDSQGNQLAEETRGPYYSTAQLISDTASAWVTFEQATSLGATDNLPAALDQTPLTGGADPSDLTDASHVTALANFPASLGPGTVALPGKTSDTAWQGIRDHVNATNRWGVLDMVDSDQSEAVIAQKSVIGSGDWSRCFFIQGSTIIPGVVPNANRVVAGSASVAALAARVAQTPNQAQAPGGQKWPLGYALGFTQYFGPVPVNTLPTGGFSQEDVQAMEAAGINCFANFYGALCLFGFVSPVSPNVDAIYDQATATRERMALVNDCEIAMAPYLFDPIDPETIANMTADLNAVCLAHFNGGALYGADPSQAFQVNTAAPINNDQTAQAKRLNAQLLVRITRYADTVEGDIAVIPVTVALPAASS